MSQFRQLGTYYVSQWGGDSLNPGTEVLPLSHPFDYTVNSAVNVGVIGSGHYTGDIGAGASTSRNHLADGKVIFDLLGTAMPNSYIANGIHFRNVGISNLITLTDCFVESGNYPMRGGKLRNLIKGSILMANGFSGDFKNSIVDLDPGSPTPTYTTTPNNTADSFSYNYFSINTICRINPISGSFARHTNNLINGPILIGGVTYEAKFLIDGSPRPDANPGIPDVATSAFTAFYSQGNFACESSDLKFIDIVSKTVEADSILLQKSNANGYIGGVKVGKSISLNESGFTIEKTNIDDSNPSFWKIAPGFNYGKARFAGKVSDSLISAQNLDIRIPFNFDGYSVGGSTDNNNVPDAWDDLVTLDTKGTLPNRLTFQVRSSVLTNPNPAVDGDWDNDASNSGAIAGQYYLMEYGLPMKFHIDTATAYGQANSGTINAATKISFNYRSLDIIVTITNNREI